MKRSLARTRWTYPLLSMLAVACNTSPEEAGGAAPLSGPQVDDASQTLNASALTAPTVSAPSPSGPRNWMSSTCTGPVDAERFEAALASGNYQVVITDEIEVESDELVRESVPNGLLECRALRVSFRGARQWIGRDATRAEHALLFVEASRIFHRSDGVDFYERACETAESADSVGSLSSRVTANPVAPVAILVELTGMYGPVIRGVATVRGETIIGSEQRTIPISSLGSGERGRAP